MTNLRRRNMPALAGNEFFFNAVKQRENNLNPTYVIKSDLKESVKRDIYQRRFYAARQMGKAVDRFESAADSIEKDKARKWIEAWCFFSSI